MLHEFAIAGISSDLKMILCSPRRVNETTSGIHILYVTDKGYHHPHNEVDKDIGWTEERSLICTRSLQYIRLSFRAHFCTSSSLSCVATAPVLLPSRHRQKHHPAADEH